MKVGVDGIRFDAHNTRVGQHTGPLALELQAFCESVPGISQFVFRWIAAGRGGRTLRTGQQQGVRLVRAEAKCCERQHRGKQYPQTHAQIVTGNSDEKEISIGRVYLRVYVGTRRARSESFTQPQPTVS